MYIVEFRTYTQYVGYFDDSDELTEDETIEEEYNTLEDAKREANKNKYGCRGQYVEVYINGEYYRDYER